MTIIHFVRHGEVYNPQKILYSRLPRFCLSAPGQQQAAAAGAYLKDRPLAAVISSPLLRARQTARYIAEPHGLRVQRSALINEVFTPHQGRSIAELEAEGWILYENLPPGYETPGDILARTLRLIARLRQQYPDQEVAAVSHGDVVLALHFWIRDIPFTDGTKNAVDPYPATASITTLTFANGAEKPAFAYKQPY
jgi:broad specificity phosphatase PhoE